MTVHFIGAGPGAADLLTVRATRLLAAAPVCLYAGTYVTGDILDHCPAGAELIDTAGLTLDEITAHLVRAHHAGHDVARLCSGDPSLYSALHEQTARLDAAAVPWDVTPGVPAYAAAAARLGRELTVPEVAQSVVLTRTHARSTRMPAGEDLERFAGTGATLALHLAITRTHDLAERLIGTFVRDGDGRRPVFGASEKFQTDPHWRDHLLFYEYFHGDSGRGVGASHQTGWTGLVAKLLQPRRREP